MRSPANLCFEMDLKGGRIAGFGGGTSDRLLVLICMGEKDEDWIERHNACDWRILSIAPDGSCDEYELRNQKDNFNFVQPLPDGFLLARSRCRFVERDTRPNGKVFDFEGELLRSFLLGDGIQDVQTTNSGQIWASYFDEGIIGNLGWRQPIGACGLRQFDDHGNGIFRFTPTSGLDDMVDCYALNVTSNNEVWCCYYTEFPIVRIKDQRIAQHWNSPIRGSSGLCVWRDRVLMQGGYQSDEWRLLRLGDEIVRVENSFEFVSRTGNILRAGFARARGDSVWFLEGSDVYRVTLRDLTS